MLLMGEISLIHKMDVPENFLDISRYEECYGKLSRISLYEGIIKTADFMKQNSIV